MYEFGPLRVEVFNDMMFQENGMLVWCDGEPDAWIVDPGLPPQPLQIAEAIEAHGLSRLAILLTHCHADHIAGVGPLCHAFEDVPVLCPADELELLTSAEANLSADFGMPIQCDPTDQLVRPGEKLSLGPTEWRVLNVAGHSPGAVAYYCEEHAVAIVGDALFAESIGRYDFPHSSREKLLRNIRENLLTLPDETVILPGHGPAATIEYIRAHNDVLRQELER